jgi:hypothetical protein
LFFESLYRRPFRVTGKEERGTRSLKGRAVPHCGMDPGSGGLKLQEAVLSGRCRDASAGEAKGLQEEASGS